MYEDDGDEILQVILQTWMGSGWALAKGRMWRRDARMTLTNHVVKDRMRAIVYCINTFDFDLINYLQHCKLQLHPATLHLCSRVVARLP